MTLANIKKERIPEAENVEREITEFLQEEDDDIVFCDLCDFASEEKEGLAEHMMSSHMTDYYSMSCLGFRWQFFSSWSLSYVSVICIYV